MWVPNVIDTPAEKRAVAIALVNALGNLSSIYGVFLWPKSDAPQYVPGFSATTIFIAGICVLAPVIAWRFGREKGTGGIGSVFRLAKGKEDVGVEDGVREGKGVV